ncbi:MAG: hypothetical protein JW774_05440, partial [Candidatus Aureabacteria bacterium]|nr:hypothetical protein [Candidatus Auribacterota bacterium]
TIFILISKNTSSLLPTIVSRCQIIEFHPVDLSLMTSWLEEQNHLPLPASILARLAKGCPGMVKGDRLGQLIENRELIFSIIEDWSKRGKLALIEGAESIVSFLNREKKKKEKEMEKQFKKGKSGKNKTRQASTEESGETFDETMDSEEVKADIEGKSRERLDGLLQICWDFFKDAALLQMGFSADKLIHADRIDLIRTAADKINHIEHHILFLNQFHKQLLFSNVNQKLALEMLFFNLFPV